MTQPHGFLFERAVDLPGGASAAYAWHARPGALSRLMPPWESARVVARRGGFADGAETELRVKVGPVTRRWVARHRDHIADRQFVDEQLIGPFDRWVHTHRFDPIDAAHCRLTDRIEYLPPFGALGRAAQPAIARRLERTFRYRHEVLSGDLASHARYPAQPLSIALTGASGMLGTALTAYLTTAGHRVIPVVRHPPEAGEIGWDPATGRIDAGGLEGLDAVVHLAGESVARRWTTASMRRIWDSRERGTQLLARTLAGLARPPGTLVCASAVGIYGDRGTEVLSEDSPIGSADGRSFLPGVGRAWEAATEPAAAAGLRVVRLRIGIVLTAAGGALPPMMLPFRFGVGGPTGSGRQWMSWIALDDLLGAFEHVLLTAGLSGPVNAVGPTPVTNGEFSDALAHVLHRPGLIPAPAAALRLVLGQMAEELLLASQRVVPEQLRRSGFVFRYAQLEGALRHVLGR
jgi:uncharacterized protein (TIGR01777 family)